MLAYQGLEQVTNAGPYQGLEQVTNICRNVAQVSAIIIGGLWAYLKFVRGRTFRYRGELSVTAKHYTFEDEPAIWAEVRFKNAGLSRIPLAELGAQVALTWLPSGRWGHGPAVWSVEDNSDWAPSTAVLLEHEAVEPGEEVSDEQLIVPSVDLEAGLPIAYRIKATITSPRRFPRRGAIKWSAFTVIPASALVLNAEAGEKGNSDNRG